MRRNEANCSLRISIIFLLAIIALQWAPQWAPQWALHSSFASEPSDEGELSFCSFGPKVTVLPSSASRSSDPCIDHVHVQGVLWKCGSSEEVSTQESHYLDELNKEAREQCQKHCAGLGSSCHGNYSIAPICGLKTDREMAVTLGKQYGCRKDCTGGGTAFTYCSLYNAGYQGKGTDAVQAAVPNCECRSN
jgi:hypothetical protein